MSEQAFKLDKDMQDAIYLIACAVKEITPDRERVQGMDLQKVFAIAEGHSLATAAAFAVEAAGFQSGQTTKILAEAVLRNTRFSLDREAVTAKLREAGIWHVLLKGAVLRDYYPKPEMREMSDHDILFDDARSADVKAIMEGLGYEVTRFGHCVHDVYQKPPVMNFEMHRELFSNSVEMEGARAYYKNVNDRLLGEG
ncbi:MAG: nucleotidyltransferase family protein, partial [Lachnospiraceae bacterium]|nr:nucleotidyltransferase family protein [Lachnospiraceae bacterium]